MFKACNVQEVSVLVVKLKTRLEVLEMVIPGAFVPVIVTFTAGENVAPVSVIVCPERLASKLIVSPALAFASAPRRVVSVARLEPVAEVNTPLSSPVVVTNMVCGEAYAAVAHKANANAIPANRTRISR